MAVKKVASKKKPTPINKPSSLVAAAKKVAATTSKTLNKPKSPTPIHPNKSKKPHVVPKTVQKPTVINDPSLAGSDDSSSLVEKAIVDGAENKAAFENLMGCAASVHRYFSNDDILRLYNDALIEKDEAREMLGIAKKEKPAKAPDVEIDLDKLALYDASDGDLFAYIDGRLTKVPGVYVKQDENGLFGFNTVDPPTPVKEWNAEDEDQRVPDGNEQNQEEPNLDKDNG